MKIMEKIDRKTKGKNERKAMVYIEEKRSKKGQ
jgi:hypothetical protein